MNEKEFQQVLRTKRFLAFVLWANTRLAYEGKENKLSQAVYDYCRFVEDAVYHEDAPQCFVVKADPLDNSFKGLMAFGKASQETETRLIRFWDTKDVVDEFAHKIWYMYDNGEIRL